MPMRSRHAESPLKSLDFVIVPNAVSANLPCTDIELVLEVAEMRWRLCVYHHVLTRMTLVNPLLHSGRHHRGITHPDRTSLDWEPEAGPLDVKPYSNLAHEPYQ